MKVFTLPLLFFTLSCAYSVHQVHVSDFVPSRSTKEGRIIHAHSEQKVLLGLIYSTNYVDRALGDLMAKCPGGTISGITTEHMTQLGFFSWINHIFITGQCMPPSRQTAEEIQWPWIGWDEREISSGFLIESHIKGRYETRS
jgi:hypothetical protein